MNIRRLLRKVWCYGEMLWAWATHGTDRLLRRRFNRWARQGRGESMARDHARISETVWEGMELSAADRILDLGCGEGWACRLLARRAPEGCLIMGLDISDQMIRLAREKSRSFSNVSYHCGRAEQIPVPSGYFTKIVSIEAFYYFQHQDEVLGELLRVAQPGGQLNLLLCLFEDDPKEREWFEDVGLPVHNRAVHEYKNMLERDGWIDVDCRVLDFRSNPCLPSGPHDPHDRPLLITARKPS
jgi:ubiquinone/menaquinone biosynthesis C-methylase UbiE